MSGRELGHGGALGGTPDVEDGFDERPGGLDAVAAIKEGGIAADAVVQECRVSAARGVPETLAIAEIHGDVPDAHFGSRALSAETDGNAFGGLDIQDEAVGVNFLFAEHDVPSAVKLDHDLCGALCEG